MTFIRNLLRTAHREKRSPGPSQSSQTTPAVRPGCMGTVLKGTAVGAAAGALAMTLYSVAQPFFFFNVAEMGSAYIAGDTRASLLIAGFAIGAIAGAIRTCVDMQFPNLSSYEKSVNTGCGMLAGPVVVLTRCILLPAIEDLWYIPFSTFLQSAVCVVVGGSSVSFLAPVGITASAVARWATRSDAV